MGVSADWEVKLGQARSRRPLRVIITEEGCGPKGDNWKSFRCPFCDHKSSAGLFAAKHGGGELFKCHHTSCPSGGKALDEVGFVAERMGSSRKDAFRVYLQSAGCWDDGPRLGPTTLPGSRPRKVFRDVRPDEVPPVPPMEGEPEPAPADFVFPEGISEDIPTASAPQSMAAPTPATPLRPALIDAPREALPADAATTAKAAPAEPVAGAGVPGEGEDPAELDRLRTENDERAEDEFAQRGDVLPVRKPEPTITAEEVQRWMAEQRAIAAQTADGPAGDTPVAEAAAAPGRALVLDADVRAALRWFYERLDWSEADAEQMFARRGLRPETQRVFGVRANRPENLRLLQAMHPRFGLSVLLRAGLWERPWSDRPLRADLFPKGHLPEVVEGCHPARYYFGYSFQGTERRPDGSKVPRYAWTGAPIIPYFDHLPEAVAPLYGFVGVTEGEFKAMAWWQVFARNVERQRDPDPAKLIALRPHKHWARGETPHAFLTPPGGGKIHWKSHSLAFGVAALPGISFGRKRGGTWATRHELDEFLRLTEADTAMVVYDSEEKGDPALPRYQPDVEARFDSLAWALFLARDLARERSAWVGELPEAWRDSQGKADWDGVLARLVGVPAPEAPAEGSPKP